MKVTRPDLTLIEFDARGDFGGAEPHFHKLHSDTFYVLSGTIDFVVDDEPFTAEAGALTFFPPEIVHSFTVGSGGAPLPQLAYTRRIRAVLRRVARAARARRLAGRRVLRPSRHLLRLGAPVHA